MERQLYACLGGISTDSMQEVRKKVNDGPWAEAILVDGTICCDKNTKGRTRFVGKILR